jgi:hypothetical protein
MIEKYRQRYFDCYLELGRGKYIGYGIGREQTKLKFVNSEEKNSEKS